MRLLRVKVNQIGTIPEAFDGKRLGRRSAACIQVVLVSHRSAETEDTTIADFQLLWRRDDQKQERPARSERNAKYNQLLRIEEELGKAGSLWEFD